MQLNLYNQHQIKFVRDVNISSFIDFLINLNEVMKKDEKFHTSKARRILCATSSKKKENRQKSVKITLKKLFRFINVTKRSIISCFFSIFV